MSTRKRTRRIFAPAVDLTDHLRKFPQMEQRQLKGYGLTVDEIASLERDVAYYRAQRSGEAAAPRRAKARELWNGIARDADQLADKLGEAIDSPVTWKQWEQAVAQHETRLLHPTDKMLAVLRYIAMSARAARERAEREMAPTKPLQRAPRELAAAVKRVATKKHRRATLEACFRLADEPERDVTPLL